MLASLRPCPTMASMMLTKAISKRPYVGNFWHGLGGITPKPP